MTYEQAIAMVESGWWKRVTPRQAALWQLNERLLCMPFTEFHLVTEEALGRPVFTHEFAGKDQLVQELHGEKDVPTLQEILAPLGDKWIMVNMPEKDDL